MDNKEFTITSITLFQHGGPILPERSLMFSGTTTHIQAKIVNDKIQECCWLMMCRNITYDDSLNMCIFIV